MHKNECKKKKASRLLQRALLDEESLDELGGTLDDEVNRADALLSDRHDIDGAVALYKKVAKRAKKSADKELAFTAARRLRFCYDHKGQHWHAYEALSKAFKHDKANDDLRTLVAVAAARIREHDKVVGVLKGHCSDDDDDHDDDDCGKLLRAAKREIAAIRTSCDVLSSDLVANILKGGALDDQHCPGNKGLNICYVHRAAYGSHVLALEELIKLGAAISIPVTVAATDKILQDMKRVRPSDWIQCNLRRNVFLLPPGTDALMMACLVRGQSLQTKKYMIKSIGEKACNKRLNDQVEVIRLLLSYGAHVQQRMQPYPSHWPKKLHDPLLGQFDYLQRGCPLSLATFFHDIEVIELLLSHGAPQLHEQEFRTLTSHHQMYDTVNHKLLREKCCMEAPAKKKKNKKNKKKKTKKDNKKNIPPKKENNNNKRTKRPEAWCRCGSRIALSKCHYSGLQTFSGTDETPPPGCKNKQTLGYGDVVDTSLPENEDGRRRYRWSPKAPCNCTMGKKEREPSEKAVAYKNKHDGRVLQYYKCCGGPDARGGPSGTCFFMSDRDGGIFTVVSMPEEMSKMMLKRRNEMWREVESRGGTREELLEMNLFSGPVDDVATVGLSQAYAHEEAARNNLVFRDAERQLACLRQMAACDTLGMPPPLPMLGIIMKGLRGDGLNGDPEARDGKRSIEVHADVTEVMVRRHGVNSFLWKVDHWQLGKRELELRAEQFNRALDVVAKEKKLTPEVVANNRASVFAPCGNPRCAKWETTKMKEFLLCKRCTKCAWCSEACQRAHWKMGHKKECDR